jgi:hypothetical protein
MPFQPAGAWKNMDAAPNRALKANEDENEEDCFTSSGERDAESLPLISVSITRYSPDQTSMIQTSKADL